MDLALTADAARRRAIAEFEAKRAEQKRLGKLIREAQGEKQELLARTRPLAEVKAAEAAQAEAEAAWQAALLSLPNLTAEETPRAARTTSSCSRPSGRLGSSTSSRATTWSSAGSSGAIDLERGAKVSGSGSTSSPGSAPSSSSR